MTLCIAASCVHEGKPAIVLCCDCQGTYNTTKCDDLLKLFSADNASILYSGEESPARELSAVLTPVFKEYESVPKTEDDFDLRVNGLLGKIRDEVKKFYCQIVKDFLCTNYAIHPGGFKIDDYGKENIAKIVDANCGGPELIIAYANEIEPILIQVTASGKVHWLDNYICIGSGAETARTILAQHNHDVDLSLMECSGRVLAAKKITENNIYVGNSTIIEFMLHGKDNMGTSEEGWAYIKANVKLIDPQKHLEFRQEFLESLSDEQD